MVFTLQRIEANDVSDTNPIVAIEVSEDLKVIEIVLLSRFVKQDDHSVAYWVDWSVITNEMA